VPIKGTRGATVRFDVLNVFDNSYELRDGTGVGVGAPQFGLRRTFLVSLTQKF
jgi:outer membrane receptor protein involved in Fe transport